MKRTNTIVWSVATVVLAVAMTAGPAAATTGYEWLNKGDGSSTASQQPQSGHSSINAILGASGATAGAVTDRAAAPSTGYRSVSSIVGSEPIPEQTVSVVHEGDGFSWGDASIGAGAALVLLLISGMTAYELRRHRRVTVASGA
jgi:hypothetical protein